MMSTDKGGMADNDVNTFLLFLQYPHYMTTHITSHTFQGCHQRNRRQHPMMSSSRVHQFNKTLSHGIWFLATGANMQDPVGIDNSCPTLRTYVHTYVHCDHQITTFIHTFIHTYIHTYIRTHLNTYICTHHRIQKVDELHQGWYVRRLKNIKHRVSIIRMLQTCVRMYVHTYFILDTIALWSLDNDLTTHCTQVHMYILKISSTECLSLGRYRHMYVHMYFIVHTMYTW